MPRLPVFLLSALLLGLATPAPAEEAYEDTERRLKRLGIDAEMQAEIHGAIERGVAWLRGRQAKDGSLGAKEGHTAMAGLALRHAGLPEAVADGRRAIRWLVGPGWDETRKDVYTAGIASMLLMADRSNDAFHQKLHRALASPRAMQRGYWVYKTHGHIASPNLSTSQFACLGLWAAERRGVKPARKAWRRHLEAILEAQQENGSWGYRPAGFGTDFNEGYPTGTFMGLADLALIRQALREDIEEQPDLWARVTIATAAGRAALRRHAQWVLSAPRLETMMGVFPYYRLYALEKVCIFLDCEDVGGIAWYRDGARMILRQQERDGSWPSGAADWPNISKVWREGWDPVHASFALLFLLRASEVYHPVTPRSLIRGPVTPGPGTTPGARGAPPPAEAERRRGLPLAHADRCLNRLEDLLETHRVRNLDAVLDGFRLLGRIYESYRDGGDEQDAWRRRAEGLLLRVSVAFRERRKVERPVWHALALKALAMLAETDPRVASRLQHEVLRAPLDEAFPASMRLAWYGAALDGMRRLNVPGLRSWLLDRCLSAEAPHAPRTSAALTCLGGMDVPTPADRHETAAGVMAGLSPALEAPQWQQTYGLGMDVAVLLTRLTRPEESLVTPGALRRFDGSVLVAWWKKHRSRHARVWQGRR